MTKRIFLHVGTPKTGTSFLQDVLFRNRDVLAAHGISYPAERFDAHFLAAVDLLRLPWGGLEAQARGAWADLAAAVRAAEGTVIVSHEILAVASAGQARRAIADLTGGRDDVEVHLLVSARDLVRQMPAEWQENVKYRSEISYAKFLGAVRNPRRSGRVAAWFWSAQEVPDILRRWGGTLPPERVHVVTVPQPGAPRELLWQRFAGVLGLDGLPLDLAAERANVSLGVPETALVRRLNRAMRRRVDPDDHRPLVLELLAHRTLAQRTGSPRLALPRSMWPWVRETTEVWIAALTEAGYDVVGDLADLRGTRPRRRHPDPDAAATEQFTDAAVAAITALVDEAARLRRRELALERELAETRHQLEQARNVTVRRRAAEKAVGRLEGSRGGQRALRLYRAVRGRNSAEA